MTWAATFEAIRSALVVASGLSDGAVVPFDGPQPFADPVMRLSVLVDRGVEPRPMRRRTVLPTPETRVQRDLYQQREVTVTARVESVSAATSANAMTYLQEAIEGLYRLGPEDPVLVDWTGPARTLRDANITLVRTYPILTFSGTRGGENQFPLDGRALTVYTTDLIFRYVRERTDCLVRTIGSAPITIEIGA